MATPKIKGRPWRRSPRLFRFQVLAISII